MMKAVGTYPVAALDLGLMTGWAVDTGKQVVWGTWELQGDYGQRIAQLHDSLFAALRTVNLVAYETPFIGRPRAARTGHGYEATLLAVAARYEIPAVGVPPKTLKKFATKDGNADKTAMLIALQREWQWVGRGAGFNTAINEHEVDACWLIHYMKRTGRVREVPAIKNGNGLTKGARA